MRYRDLETGAFLTRDPIGYGDGPNIYCYVHCNPIMGFDPLGLRNFWNSLTWFTPNAISWSVKDSFNPWHESACWKETGAGLKEGALAGCDIVTDTFTPNYGIFAEVHENAEAYKGPGAEASRFCATVAYNALNVAVGKKYIALSNETILLNQLYGAGQTAIMGEDVNDMLINGGTTVTWGGGAGKWAGSRGNFSVPLTFAIEASAANMVANAAANIKEREMAAVRGLAVSGGTGFVFGPFSELSPWAGGGLIWFFETSYLMELEEVVEQPSFYLIDGEFELLNEEEAPASLLPYDISDYEYSSDF
jgi:hypothetical protein